MDNSNNIRTIIYKFKFSENNEQDFVIKMDSETLDILHEPEDSYPQWAKLEYQQCSNCPLKKEEYEYCPIAMKLAGTVDFFCKPLEFKDVDLKVETPERTFSRKANLKSAAVSLIGIYMATSGCPIMDKLRPMARHHLPLATTPETTYRSISNYLISQYLLSTQDKEADWDLKNLSAIYDAIKIVNTHFRERLLKISSKDYALSAILALDAYAYYINLSLIGDTFYTIESLFEERAQTKTISSGSPQEDNNVSNNLITYKYQFKFNDNTITELPLDIDADTLTLVNLQKEPLPPWAELNCQKCPNCTLDDKLNPYCPAAAGIAGALEAFSGTITVDKANVTVKSAERDFLKYTSFADGLSSMMELVMTSSGCPVLAQLRAFVRYHLPFEANEEKIYRSLGMYLLYQKFAERNKDNPDWGLSHFHKFFNEINIVYISFCSRLKEIPADESLLDILTNLDCFNKYLDFSLHPEDITKLNNLFAQSYK